MTPLFFLSNQLGRFLCHCRNVSSSINLLFIPELPTYPQVHHFFHVVLFLLPPGRRKVDLPVLLSLYIRVLFRRWGPNWTNSLFRWYRTLRKGQTTDLCLLRLKGPYYLGVSSFPGSRDLVVYLLSKSRLTL